MTHDLCYMKSVTLFSEVLIIPPHEEHATLILKPHWAVTGCSSVLHHMLHWLVLSLSSGIWSFDQALLKLMHTYDLFIWTPLTRTLHFHEKYFFKLKKGLNPPTMSLIKIHRCINRVWLVTSPTCSYWGWCPFPAAPCLCQHELPASCQVFHHTGCPPPWRCPPDRRPDSVESPCHNHSGFGWRRSLLGLTPVYHYRL